MKCEELAAVDSPSPLPSRLEGFSHRYASATVIRALVQAIPTVGGPLDTLLAATGGRWQQSRVEHFLAVLATRLETLERFEKLPPVAESEPLFDFTARVIDNVSQTRSVTKREYFANIIARQIATQFSWDEADAAERLLGDLTENHITILRIARDAPKCGGAFEGLGVVTVATYIGSRTEAEEPYPLELRAVFPNLRQAALEHYCSELVGRGLLHDEGMGRFETSALQYLTATDLATWFLGWISDPTLTRTTDTNPTT